MGVGSMKGGTQNMGRGVCCLLILCPFLGIFNIYIFMFILFKNLIYYRFLLFFINLM